MLYTLTQPRAQRGDVVIYADQRGKPRAGVCQLVHTTYSDELTAIHHYSVLPKKSGPLVKVADGKLLEVAPGEAALRKARG